MKLRFERLERRELLTRVLPDADDIWQTPSHGEWYEWNPTYVDSYDDTGDWLFSTPEAQGIDGAMLADGAEELAEDPELFSLLVVRNDRIVFEEYYHGSARTHSNNIHSASKSILSALVGLAIEHDYLEGKDQLVADVVPGYFAGYGASDPRRDLTVGNLLSMTAGLNWVEDVTEYTMGPGDDWVQEVLDQGSYAAPGTDFRYSTGVAHLTSAVVTAATGMALPDFAHAYLFGPLNVNAEHWGRDPQGIHSGGYNLYITPREMARFGSLYLNDGMLDGEEVLPEWIVEESLTANGEVSYYGDFWWLQQNSGYEEFVAWGWGGQFIYLYPELDLMVVSTADTSGFSTGAEPPVKSFIRDHVIPAIFADPPDAVPGDVNGDQVVDGLDVNILSMYWLMANATPEQGDVNGDGVVNALDANVVSANWGAG